MTINYKSNINFTNDSGFIPMTTFKEWQIEGRLIPDHFLPVPIIDRWNGKDLVVHQTSWDYYTFDINVNAVQMKMLSNILLSQDIVIEDLDNDLTITLDTTLPEYNTFEKGEFIGETSNYMVTVKCRTNPTFVNRQEPTEQTFNITVDGAPYYTDNDAVTTVLASELDDEQDNDGLNPSSSSDFKKAIKFVNKEENNARPKPKVGSLQIL